MSELQKAAPRSGDMHVAYHLPAWQLAMTRDLSDHKDHARKLNRRKMLEHLDSILADGRAYTVRMWNNEDESRDGIRFATHLLVYLRDIDAARVGDAVEGSAVPDRSGSATVIELPDGRRFRRQRSEFADYWRREA